MGRKKRTAATKSHPGWNTQVESNLAPLGEGGIEPGTWLGGRVGFQAGGPTTRLDPGGWGGNWENPRRLGTHGGALELEGETLEWEGGP